MVFIHSSDELYGADRVLLDMLSALSDSWRSRTEVWLPTDLPHPETSLCIEVEALGVRTRHLELPVLRRAYLTPGGLARLAWKSVQLTRQLRRQQPGVVYCTTSAGFLAAPVARLAGARTVGHVQELWSRRDRLLLQLPARFCAQLVAISEPVRDQLPASLVERTTVVHNATREPDRHVPLDDRSGPLRFVVASRWNSWKGHRTLMEAWDRSGCPGVLTVLGGPPASGEAIDVPALANAITGSGSVEIVGEVGDASPYLERADVVVVPSDSPEPFGLVAIEAFARGRPVIGSDAGGLADIITDGWDGWLFPPQDVAGLAAVLRSVDRAMVTTAAANARGTYLSRYTTQRFTQDWTAALGLQR